MKFSEKWYAVENINPLQKAHIQGDPEYLIPFQTLIILFQQLIYY